jgi:hypothetical protein
MTHSSQSALSWEKCRWVGNLYDARLGGIDANYDFYQKGTNGSVAPQKTLDVLQALRTAAAAAADKAVVKTPQLIDAGTSEGRALLYWACTVAQLQRFEPRPIYLHGFELPHLKGYRRIHRIAKKRAAKKLSCPVNINVVWKDCLDINSLSQEFDVLSENVCVLYSFWTCWYAEDKVKLLDLVAAEPNIVAIAVYLTSKDLPFDEQPFNTEFILQHLSKHSAESRWTLHTSIDGCRFIGGSETATAVVFRRMRDTEELSDTASEQEPQELLQAEPAVPDMPVHFDGFQVLDLGLDTKDGWSDMCNECGGCGGG